MTDAQEILDVSGDGLLRLFAKMAQEDGLSLGLTLHVGGAIITGELIGRDKWLEKLAELMATAGDTGRTLGGSLVEAYRAVDL